MSAFYIKLCYNYTEKSGEEMNIKITLKNDDIISEENYIAKITDKKIVYYEKEYKVTILLSENLKLIRENDDIKIELEFISNTKTIGKCLLKKENLVTYLDVFTDYVIMEENLIIVNYNVITTEQNVLYRLEMLK